MLSHSRLEYHVFTHIDIGNLNLFCLSCLLQATIANIKIFAVLRSLVCMFASGDHGLRITGPFRFRFLAGTFSVRISESVGCK